MRGVGGGVLGGGGGGVGLLEIDTCGRFVRKRRAHLLFDVVGVRERDRQHLQEWCWCVCVCARVRVCIRGTVLARA